jgi:hypothetical protein
MKPFNFAETKILERKYFRRYTASRMRWIAILAALTIGMTVFSLGIKASAAKRTVMATAAISRVESLCKEAREQTNNDKNGLMERNWQAEQRKSSRRVLNLINSVLACAPVDVWLSSVKGLDSTPQVMIQGTAASFSSLSTMMAGLRQMHDSTSVQLTNSRALGPNGTEPIEFTISLTMKQPGTPAATGPQQPAPAGVPALGGSGA